MPGSYSAISPKSVNSPKRGQIGLFAAMSIGIGGMVGAGLANRLLSVIAIEGPHSALVILRKGR